MPEPISTKELTDWVSHVSSAESPEFRAIAEDLLKLRRLLAAFVEDSDCKFDHNGSCQEHDFFEIEPGELCPNAEARRYLEEVDNA